MTTQPGLDQGEYIADKNINPDAPEREDFPVEEGSPQVSGPSAVPTNVSASRGASAMR